MKVFLIVLTAFLSAPIFMATSCEQQKQNVNCDGAICTEVFVSVTVSIIQNGAPMELDEVYTTRKGSNEHLTFDQSMTPQSYVVVDDSYKQKLQNAADEFHLVGMKNGKKVLDETYVISADCCHVKKEKGKDEIKL